MRHNNLSFAVERRPIAALTAQPGFTLDKIPIPPSLNNLFFNSNDGGRRVTKRYETWRNAAGWIVAAARRPRVRGPVKILITIEDGGTRADTDNLIKPLLDLIVAHQLIEDDGAHIVRDLRITFGQVEGCQINVQPAGA